jgi:hypothetical protein
MDATLLLRRRRRRARLLLAGALLTGGVVLAVAAVAEAPAAAPSVADRIDRRVGELRVAIVVAALAVWLLGLWARRRSPGADRARAIRRVVLAALAAAAFAANFNFFLARGLHRHEFYHYYLGSKYFPELGYFDLYRCSVEALRERGEGVASRVELMTDLRLKQRRPAAELLAGEPCKRQFSPPRWSAFQADIANLLALMGEDVWLGVLRDHGYNPSPVWTLVGRPIAELVPSDRAGLWQIARLDLWLMLGALAAVGFGFGLEAACLVAIAWGANGLNRYQWIGDAFLRHLWLATLLVGLVCVRRGWRFAGGALLAFSALERVFPSLVFSAIGLREARRLVRDRRIARPSLRVAAGALVAAIVLVGASLAVSGRGLAAWREFGENMVAQTSFTPKNSLGLAYVLGFTTAAPPASVLATARTRAEAIEANKRLALARRRPLQIAALALFAALFWRATRPARAGEQERLEDWEVLAGGLLAIPFVTLPASYYVGFVTVGALLATRRPRVGTALLATTLAFAIALVLDPIGSRAHVASSLALLAFCLWTLFELRRPARPASEVDHASAS